MNNRLLGVTGLRNSGSCADASCRSRREPVKRNHAMHTFYCGGLTRHFYFLSSSCIGKHQKRGRQMTSIQELIKNHGNRMAQWKTTPHSPPLCGKSPFRFQKKRNTKRMNVKETSRHNHTSTRKSESHATCKQGKDTLQNMS